MKRGEESRLRRQHRILESASQVFAENDYAEVSLGRVALGARVSRGTVYNHFGSKEELYRKVLAIRLGELIERLDRVVTEEADPISNLRRCVVQPFLFFIKYPNLLLLWRREDLRQLSFGQEGCCLDEMGREMTSRHLGGMRVSLVEVMARVLRRGAKAGCFRSVEPILTAHAILGAVEGTASSILGAHTSSPAVKRAKEDLSAFVGASLLLGRREVNA